MLKIQTIKRWGTVKIIVYKGFVFVCVHSILKDKKCQLLTYRLVLWLTTKVVKRQR